MNNEESMLIFASNLRSPGLHDDVIELLHLRPGTWDYRHYLVLDQVPYVVPHKVLCMMDGGTLVLPSYSTGTPYRL